MFAPFVPDTPAVDAVLDAALAGVLMALTAAAVAAAPKAAERTVRTLENEARIAGQRVESFQAALDGQKKNVSTANDSEVQLRALEREARTLRDQLEQYMQRYREAVARDTLNATPADARIAREAKFDPDIFVVEIEDRQGRHLLDEDGLA